MKRKKENDNPNTSDQELYATRQDDQVLAQSQNARASTNARTVQRLMREHGIQGAKRRGKPWRTTKPDLTATRARDLVCRDFAAQAPNHLWVGDFVRHEALWIRMEVRDHHRLAVAAAGLKLRAA